MKEPKTEIVNRSKPVDLSTLVISEDDCFGNEWSNTHPSCVKCSHYEECMVVFLSKGTSKKRDQIKKYSENFFDELDWTQVPWGDIYELGVLEPGTITYDELFATVKTLSKCIDDTTVHFKLKHWIAENNLQIKNGCLYSY